MLIMQKLSKGVESDLILQGYDDIKRISKTKPLPDLTDALDKLSEDAVGFGV